MSNYLFVVAHPDDETIGAGGTIKKLSESGHKVDLCVLSSKVQARTLHPGNNELNDNILTVTKKLGINKCYFGEFPNIKFNTIPHLHLVQFIENCILDSNAEIVVTHHPSDTNNDHLHTSISCQAAIRLFQRGRDVVPLKEFWYMEVLSSTEWSVNTSMNGFKPNLFVEIGKNGLEFKISALQSYRGVMRPYPHPRSIEAIEGLAAYRGAQSGCMYAESFECVLRRL